MDGYNTFGTCHVVVDKYNEEIKHKVKEELGEFGIIHSTIEIELKDEHCYDKKCEIKTHSNHHHNNH